MPTEPASLPPRPFGRTDLRVTPLCLGGFSLGDFPDVMGSSVSDAQAQALLRALFAGPINCVDTAASYGESERRIGRAIRAAGGLPPGFVVCTKADRDVETNRFDGDQARRSVARSLERLGLDRIQVLHLHDPEYTSHTFEEFMAPGGAVRALVQLREQGVIGALGIAAGPIEWGLRFVETGLFDAVLTHNRYTLLNRVAEPLLEAATRRGMAVLNAAPYASGILAYGPRSNPRYAYQQAPADIIGRAERMEAACARYGVPLAAAALQFSLRDPRITSTVVGATKPERLRDMLMLAAYPIPDALWPELDALAAPPHDPEANRWAPGAPRNVAR